MWPIKTCLFFFGFIGACTLSVAYPIVGVASYMIVYQVNPNEMWWGKPLDPLGIRYSMAVAICLILGMLVSVGRVPKSKQFFGDWLLVLFLFTIIVLCSGGRFMESSEYSQALIDKMIKMTIFLVCLVRMAGTRDNFKVVIWSLVAGTLTIGYDAYYAPAGDFIRGRLNFVGGADFRESSGLAAHMAAMLPLLGAMALATRRWKAKALVAVTGILTVNTIVQCRTRSAFVGLMAGMVAAVIMAPRKRRGRVYVALLLGGIGAYSLTDNSFWMRMDSALRPMEYPNDTAIQARIELWRVGMLMFRDHPFGVGVGRFKDALQDYRVGREGDIGYSLGHRVTHNTYLLCMTELGIQGTCVFALLIGISAFKLRNCMRLAAYTRAPSESRLLTYGCTLSLVVYLVAGLFTDRLYTESFWWVLALPVCLEQAVRREAFEDVVQPELSTEWSVVYANRGRYRVTPAGVACGSLR